MSKRKPQTVSSFPKEFFAIWELAKDGKLHLDFESRGPAINFKQRLYTFRRLLHQESPALGSSYYNIDLVVREGGQGLCYIEAYTPAWKQQVRAVIATAGPPPTEAEAPVELPQFQEEVLAPSQMEQTLQNLGFGTKKE